MRKGAERYALPPHPRLRKFQRYLCAAHRGLHHQAVGRVVAGKVEVAAYLLAGLQGHFAQGVSCKLVARVCVTPAATACSILVAAETAL